MRFCSAMDPGTGNFLRSSFSDIDANLLTSEEKCHSFIDYYSNLDKEGQGSFLRQLAKDFGIDKDSVSSMANGILVSREKGEAQLLAAAERMRISLRPRYRIMFTHLGRVNGGVKFLVDLRSDVLSFRQSCINELDTALYQGLNMALRELLIMWFTVGFLQLERITWNSPCDLVQKVCDYEAVHRIKTWEDIKRRVGPYRRCYIFTHSSMPREPVVVLHTALTKEITSSIHSIIQSARFRSESLEEAYPDFLESPPTPASIPRTPTPQSPDGISSISSQHLSVNLDEREDLSQISSAVFYSITSTQKGLQGIEMGNYLIKSVVRKLQEEFPHLSQFSSLSPIPGFRDWLLSTTKHYISLIQNGERPERQLLLSHELSALKAYQTQGQGNPLEAFRDIVQTHQWYRNEALTRIMSGPLMRLCAHYLYVQKRRDYALNPVANFHLSNGAELWRINFLADTSMRGLTQSCSLMVNYRYFLDSVETNSRKYLEEHQIPVSQSVIELLSPGTATVSS